MTTSPSHETPWHQDGIEMLSILFATYVIVFGAEVVGDKTIYTLGTLATRYRLLPIFCGSTVAFVLKMLAAVLLGRAIAELPVALVATASAVTFFTMALVIWFKKPESKASIPTVDRSWGSIALASFASIVFSEWGDVGQIATATLAARYQLLQIVWLGAVLAMMTKGILAMTLGAGLRSRVPRQVLRYATCAICLAMGILAAFRIN
jgi:putative Ca2+/H+ antiporter (TMEM165/GDT1 family)